MVSPFKIEHCKDREGPKTIYNTKRLRGLEDLPYGERLLRLQLCTLELRRLHFDLYMCYRIIQGGPKKTGPFLKVNNFFI